MINWNEVKQATIIGFLGITGIFAAFALVAVFTLLFMAGVNELSCILEVYQGLQCGPG